MDSLSSLGRAKQMKNTNSKAVLILFGILAAVLFFTLVPNIEETRLEARVGLAYRTVCEIADSDIMDGASAPQTTNDTDPWGQPYHVTKSDHGIIVASNGPNQTTLRSGFDHDDIYSSMDNSPIEMIHRNKRLQFLMALSAPAIWLIGALAYFVFVVKQSVSQPQSAE